VPVVPNPPIEQDPVPVFFLTACFSKAAVPNLFDSRSPF